MSGCPVCEGSGRITYGDVYTEWPTQRKYVGWETGREIACGCTYLIPILRGSIMRDLIVLDVETTGLNYTIHKILEVAAINTNTDEVITFCPRVDPLDLGNADGSALQVNRYYERGAWKHMLTGEATSSQYAKLNEMLTGNTLAGCNPAFDALFLAQAHHALSLTPWHHRLADLSAYAAGALGIPPNELLGLGDICERLGVEPGTAHSALDDAKATAECFRKLFALKGGTK